MTVRGFSEVRKHHPGVMMWSTAREGFTYTGRGSTLSKSSQDVPRPTTEAEPRLRSSSLDSSIPSGAQSRTESEQASLVPAVPSIEGSTRHPSTRIPGMARRPARVAAVTL